MYEAVTAHAQGMDIIVKAAAVADYRPVNIAGQKIKKGGGMTIKTEATDDILSALGQAGGKGVLVGFCMETENLMEYARDKMARKNCDIMVANSISGERSPFGSDDNRAAILTREGDVTQLPVMSKFELANVILDKALWSQKHKAQSTKHK
jgi:phosphopantothenoylcysteine decarboxylase/phosphopantothenate--cysteine ligase